MSTPTHPSDPAAHVANRSASNESTPNYSPAKRWALLAYSSVCYLLFFVTFLVLIAFVGDLGAIRSTVRPWLQLEGTGAKVALNLGLLLLFAVQHTVMARSGFKKWITRHIPEHAERPTFVLATVLVLVATVAFWQPLPLALYQFQGGARLAVHALFGLGFLIVLLASFMIDHFHLFGLKQGIWALQGKSSPRAVFTTPLFYRWVRHPLMTGMLLGIWSMTDVTAGRLLLAVAMSAYIAVGIHFEERSLTRELGAVYREYKRRVPAVVPGLRPAWPPQREEYQGPKAAPEAA